MEIYIIEEAYLSTKRVMLVGKKEFRAAALDLGHETFIIHVASLKSPSNDKKGNIHPFCQIQISSLVANETPTSISTEYFDFVDIFSLELASELFKHTRINDHTIKLVNNWPLSYGLIYSLGPMELETLKTYIETNLVNGFIWSFKSPIRASIFFDKKLDKSFQLYIDYRELNNLIIKNQYLPLLIGEFLNRLGQTLRFT